jgi:hypothetical protein
LWKESASSGTLAGRCDDWKDLELWESSELANCCHNWERSARPKDHGSWVEPGQNSDPADCCHNWACCTRLENHELLVALWQNPVLASCCRSLEYRARSKSQTRPDVVSVSGNCCHSSDYRSRLEDHGLLLVSGGPRQGAELSGGASLASLWSHTSPCGTAGGRER